MMNQRDDQKCAYCGKINTSNGFYIGASLEPAWTMHEGTGKLACPKCDEQARLEARAVIAQEEEPAQ